MSAGIDARANTWSTLALPKRAQFGYWREMICEAFLDLTPESDLRDGFAGTVSQVPLGELSVARISSQSQQVQRTQRDIDRSQLSGYYANMQVRGASVMAQGGRSTVLRPGDLAIVTTTEPFAFGFRDDFQQLSFYLPPGLVDAQVDGSIPTATRVDTATGLGASVRHCLQTLIRGELREETAARLAVHTAGMLAIAVQQPVEARTATSGHHRVHAEALADIEEHLGDYDLSPPATARRLGVSVRLLHAVFAGRDGSFTAEVRRRRLEVALRDLQDPARRYLRVIDVAVAAGFTSVATFHRAFRNQFHRTPIEVRNESTVDGW